VEGSSSNGNYGENVALATKIKKKSKKGSKGGNRSKREGKKEMSKVKFFVCHNMGHYAGQCPYNKKKYIASSNNVEGFSTKFEKEFSLLVYLSSSEISTNACYIDRGASYHIIGVHDHISQIKDIRILRWCLETTLWSRKLVVGYYPFRSSLNLPC
jgi:hypothetical protein